MKFKNGAVALLAAVTTFCVTNPVVAQERHGEYQSGWDAPPAEYHDHAIGRRGYQDGIEGARKDFENHRKPDVDNRDEYRHPPVSGADRDEYRAAFRHGYDAGVEHLMHGVR